MCVPPCRINIIPDSIVVCSRSYVNITLRLASHPLHFHSRQITEVIVHSSISLTYGSSEDGGIISIIVLIADIIFGFVCHIILKYLYLFLHRHAHLKHTRGIELSNDLSASCFESCISCDDSAFDRPNPFDRVSVNVGFEQFPLLSATYFTLTSHWLSINYDYYFNFVINSLL